MKRLLLVVLPSVVVLGALYLYGVRNWNYSVGERAGWVQEFSKKGWLCKTWEGELAMVNMPGAAPEKFFFTVRDEAVARQINKAMGRRVSLHYEEKVGLPTSCFGDTRHWVNAVTVVPEIPIAPGVSVPVPPEGVPQHPSPVMPLPQAPADSPRAPASPSPAPALQ
jgi:hypothetical protein